MGRVHEKIHRKAQEKDGLTLLKEGRYEKAKVVFQEDIREKKNLKKAYYGAGIACFELGEYEEAILYFELALQSKAEQTGTIASFLGACYMKTEQYEKALDAYENALADGTLTDHLEQEANYNLIAVYERMGNWDVAKVQIEKYIQNPIAEAVIRGEVAKHSKIVVDLKDGKIDLTIDTM